MQLENGHKLQNGKYRIQEKIGQGGFGITYRALWTMTVQDAMGTIDTEISVVIKEFFWKDYCTREKNTSYVSISSTTGIELFSRFKEKLKKEAKIISRLNHPNIVRVLNTFEENNTAYMVMQLIEGESLKDKIERLGKLDETTALKYTKQLCSALNEVHSNNILHLDIKPGNVIIDKNDNAQLIDFGISKQYNDNQKETSTTPLGISKGYTPIEQYSGIETFSPPTDIYALGATLYTMLTGQIPLEATRLAIEEQEPVHKFNSNVSKNTIAIIEKAMEIKPTKRFQTIDEFSNALDKDKVSPTLSSFYIGKYEVTQSQWKAVMGYNPSQFKGDNLPIENIDYDEVWEFIRKLNALTGKRYRLPTEAEWEFAARGGNKSQGYKYSGGDTIDNVAWISGNSNFKTHPIGTKSPNELGIYDMSGNVWEWCNDLYEKYNRFPQKNPTGSQAGYHFVCRGGSWYSSARSARVSNREHNVSGYHDNNLGFRLAYNAE